jgi:TRAP-type C4-dicarboxylate transport system substrate-binding protein
MVAGQENPITNIHTQRFHEVQSHIMMTGHMQSINAIFINENVWKSLGAENHKIFESAMEEMSKKSLQWTSEMEAPVWKTVKDYGVTVIDEAAGLKNDLFKRSVNAQIAADFPDWSSYIRDIQNMK